MSRTPLVSVGLPVYNGERYLGACLASLLAQTHANYEIIVSDNASTDGTVSILEAFAAREPRIRVLRAERNRGTAWNHERVRELARGEYFRWCGADDIIAPRCLEACVAALEEAPGAVLAFPLSIVIDESGAEVDRTRALLPLDSPDPVVRFQSLLRALPATQNAFYGLIRRRCLQRARPMRAFMANDRCLLAELALMGPFVQVREFLIYRRKHTENTVRSVRDEHRLLTPHNVEPHRMREWGVLRKNLSAAARAPVGTTTRVALLGALSGWCLSQRAELIQECKDLTVHTVRRVRKAGGFTYDNQGGA